MTQAEQLILEALQASVSQDPTLLKEAELRFQEWALEPGFYAVLMVSWRCEGVHSVHWFALRVSHSFSPSCMCACVRAFAYACVGAWVLWVHACFLCVHLYVYMFAFACVLIVACVLCTESAVQPFLTT